MKLPDLNRRIEQVWGITRQTPADKVETIARYRKLAQAATLPPDLARGRALFTRICQQCHTLFEVGGKVGPDLTGSNRANLDYLLENIVDPNAVIPADYRSANVELKDDRTLTGIIRQQDARTVVLATANEVLRLARSDIRSVEQGELSMMPEDLLTGLTNEEIISLIGYLRSPVQVAAEP